MSIIHTCRGCGCDDNNACMTDAGPCRWVSLDPPLCSACVEPDFDDGRPGPVDATGERCPMSAVPAPHQLLWTGDNDTYCVRCHGAFCR